MSRSAAPFLRIVPARSPLCRLPFAPFHPPLPFPDAYAPCCLSFRWPGNARIALNFVLNYEEGGEGCILHGDSASEHLLTEIVGCAALPGVRHINVESLYDYGALCCPSIDSCWTETPYTDDSRLGAPPPPSTPAVALLWRQPLDTNFPYHNTLPNHARTPHDGPDDIMS